MKIQKRFLKIHMVLFVVFGLIAFTSLYETTPMQMIESQITGRNPASVASAVTLKSTEILKIDCANFAQEVQVPAYQVRLEGSLCDTKDPQNVTIRNETTGKQATLFSRAHTGYMTDFIQLKGGKNQITLSYVMKNQKTKKIDLVVVR